MTQRPYVITRDQRRRIGRRLDELKRRLVAETIDPDLTDRVLEALLTNPVLVQDATSYAVVPSTPAPQQATLANIHAADREEFLYLVLPREILRLPIEKLDLKSHAYNCLKREGINNLWDLLQWSEAELLDIPIFGAKSVNVLQTRLTQIVPNLPLHLSRHNQSLKPPPGDQWVKLPWHRASKVGLTRLLSQILQLPAATLLTHTEERSDLARCLEGFGIGTIQQLLRLRPSDLLALPWDQCMASRYVGRPWRESLEHYRLDPVQATRQVIETVQKAGLSLPYLA